jgi:hypothetical protein
MPSGDGGERREGQRLRPAPQHLGVSPMQHDLAEGAVAGP